MIRLVLLLCGGLYFGLLILGEDHGQKRYGLMLADEQPKPKSSVQSVPDEARQVLFIPAQTVMEPVKVASVQPEPAAPEATQTPVAAQTPAAPLPEPEIPGGRLFTVASKLVNVREGPGKNFAVVGSLTKGEQVLVVQDENPVEGWSRVRLEGDGIEGFIATRLLVE
jgi:Bacterial SH3 domain